MIGIIVILIIYFLPSIFSGNNKRASDIVILNLFLGWTLVGWVIALMWAFNSNNIINK